MVPRGCRQEAELRSTHPAVPIPVTKWGLRVRAAKSRCDCRGEEWDLQTASFPNDPFSELAHWRSTMALSERQRAEIEHRLQDERARALRALNRGMADRASESEQDRSGDLSSVPFHMADLGTDTMQEELDASN